MRVTAERPSVGAERADRLDQFAALFRADFRRRDQACWAAVYLRGLLRAGTRKTIETIARGATAPSDRPVENLTQALQNFINQSPWDERKLLRRYRALVARTAGAGGSVVVTDMAFPKQGRQSVGVQRQYSHEHRGKINCQVAVALHHVGPAHAAPVALRLYLPRGWVQEPERLDACAVPPEFRTATTRTEIALALLDELRAAGLATAGVVLGPGYDDSQEFRDGLAARGLAKVSDTTRQRGLRLAHEVCWRLKADLGLDHFEGRSWRGFHHHAALVMLAHAFLMGEGEGYLEAGAGI
jgi:SRSO17 transposase